VALVVAEVGRAVGGFVALIEPAAGIFAGHGLAELVPELLLVRIAVLMLDLVDQAAGNDLPYKVRAAFAEGAVEQECATDARLLEMYQLMRDDVGQVGDMAGNGSGPRIQLVDWCLVVSRVHFDADEQSVR